MLQCPEIASFIHREQDISELWKAPLSESMLEAREKEKET